MKLWRLNLANNGILILLPSAGRRVGPKFSRLTWEYLFPDLCVIAIADPALSLYEDLHGAWFLDKGAGSTLPQISEMIQSIAQTIMRSTQRPPPLVFAGSSMGGYASLVLATLTPHSFAFVECPQIDLTTYADSEVAINTIFGGVAQAPKEFINVCSLIETVGHVPNARIIQQLTDREHTLDHVAHLKALVMRAPHLLTDRDLTIQYEHVPDGPEGHNVIAAQRFIDELKTTFHILRGRLLLAGGNGQSAS